MTDNPYQAPESNIGEIDPTPNDASRKTHLNFEANVKALGLLYYINSALLLVSGISFSINPSPGDIGIAEEFGIGPTILTAVTCSFALGMFLLGRGLRSFNTVARIVAIVLSAIGLLAFPFGTVISAFILYFLLSKKGAFVFTPEYQKIIASTPHIKYKTSKIVWFVVGLLLFLILIPILAVPFLALTGN